MLLEEDNMKYDDMPVGLGMALAQNPEAVSRFASMNEYEKQELINAAHAVSSKEEMRRLVNNIAIES